MACVFSIFLFALIILEGMYDIEIKYLTCMLARQLYLFTFTRGYCHKLGLEAFYHNLVTVAKSIIAINQNEEIAAKFSNSSFKDVFGQLRLENYL